MQSDGKISNFCIQTFYSYPIGILLRKKRYLLINHKYILLNLYLVPGGFLYSCGRACGNILFVYVHINAVGSRPTIFYFHCKYNKAREQ